MGAVVFELTLVQVVLCVFCDDDDSFDSVSFVLGHELYTSRAPELAEPLSMIVLSLTAF